MSKKKKTKAVVGQHQTLLAAAIVSVIVSGVTTAGALSLATSADDYARSVVSRTNASANPYRPVEAPALRASARSVREPILSKAQTDRKMKAVQRSIVAIDRRLATLDRRMESLEKNRARETNAVGESRHDAALQKLLAVRAPLEARRADLAATLAELDAE